MLAPRAAKKSEIAPSLPTSTESNIIDAFNTESSIDLFEGVGYLQFEKSVGLLKNEPKKLVGNPGKQNSSLTRNEIRTQPV